MTVSIWQADGSQPVREVDTLVVGAGLVGCAAAYFLTQAGRSVTITEAHAVALGASSRNAGFMLTGLDAYYHRAIEHYGHAAAREIWTLSRQTHAYWRGFAERGGVQLTDSGSMLLAESRAEASDLERAARALDADGFAANYTDRDPLGRGFHAAIVQPQDAAVQPYDLTWAIFRASGAELVSNNEAYRVAQDEPDVATVHTRQAIFRARNVLLCTNAYSPYIDQFFVGKVIPTRAQCFVTEPLKDGPILNTCCYSDYGYMYYRETFDGRLLLGGGRKQNAALEDNTSDDRVTDAVQHTLEAYLRQRFPEVRSPIERRWAGIMGFTPDGLPLVGTLPGAPRIGFAVGFNGHGLSLGAGVAERAVQMLIEGRQPGLFDAQRLLRH